MQYALISYALQPILAQMTGRGPPTQGRSLSQSERGVCSCESQEGCIPVLCHALPDRQQGAVADDGRAHAGRDR